MPRSIQVPLRVHPGALAKSELKHARVVAVVHVVCDRIRTHVVTSVSTYVAAEVGRAFLPGIAYRVAGRMTSSLKCVVQTEPVTDVVNRNVAFVVRRGGTAGKRRIENRNTIKTGMSGIVPGERCGADVPARQIDAVDI